MKRVVIAGDTGLIESCFNIKRIGRLKIDEKCDSNRGNGVYWKLVDPRIIG